MKNRKGFTLVELLVVIVILGIVTGLSIPLIRNIQTNNEKKEYTTYMETLKYSSKLYIDSYGEDLFGRHKSGCVTISYNDLYQKGLIKDIPIDNVSCATDNTFVRVVKLDGKYGYSTSIGCGNVINNNVNINTSISNVIGTLDDDVCRYDAAMKISSSPVPDKNNNYKKRNIKVNIQSMTGVNNNAIIYYGFSYGKNTNVINNDWKKLNIKIPGKKKQKEDVYGGKVISIESSDLVTPVGITGDLYLVLRIDKLENLAEEEWKPEKAEDGNVMYFGEYRVDNAKPQFNDSTIISSENGFNSLKPKLNLKATDNFSTTNELSMCISYGSDTCSRTVKDMKNKTNVSNYLNNTKYEQYDNDKVLNDINGVYNSSTHTIFVTIADAAGNYEKQTFQYRVARTWTLTYNSNGGSACSPASKSFTFNDWEQNLTWGDLCIPTRNNHEFLGWKTEAGTTINSSTLVNSNLAVNADWKALFTFSFKYTGKFSYKDGNAGWVNGENSSVSLMSDNWQVKFLTSGTLTVLGSLSNIDAFLVGGGGGAGKSGWDNLEVRGGAGGGGGYTNTKTNIAVEKKDYSVTIGNGGGFNTGGGTSSAFGVSAGGGGRGRAFGWLSDGRKEADNAGNGGSGGGGICGGYGDPCAGNGGAGGSNGSGGYGGNTLDCTGRCVNYGSSGGSGCDSNKGCKINGRVCTNTRAFCEDGGEVYAGGGAGGDHENVGRAGNGGGAGGMKNGTRTGGHIGTVTCRNAVANTGGGGNNYCGGSGASGIVIIRNAR